MCAPTWTDQTSYRWLSLKIPNFHAVFDLVRVFYSTSLKQICGLIPWVFESCFRMSFCDTEERGWGEKSYSDWITVDCMASISSIIENRCVSWRYPNIARHAISRWERKSFWLESKSIVLCCFKNWWFTLQPNHADEKKIVFTCCNERPCRILSDTRTWNRISYQE